MKKDFSYLGVNMLADLSIKDEVTHRTDEGRKNLSVVEVSLERSFILGHKKKGRYQSTVIPTHTWVRHGF